MKRTLIEKIPITLPDELARFVDDARIYDSSCSPEARVWFIDKDDGYYIKTCGVGTLKKEADMTLYFHQKGIGTEVLHYLSEEADWLLTRKVVGEDCTHKMYLDEPERLCDTIATELRKLHETNFSDCPIQDRMTEYFALAEENYRTGNYDKTSFPDSFGYRSKPGRCFVRAGERLTVEYCFTATTAFPISCLIIGSLQSS